MAGRPCRDCGHVKHWHAGRGYGCRARFVVVADWRDEQGRRWSWAPADCDCRRWVGR